MKNNWRQLRNLNKWIACPKCSKYNKKKHLKCGFCGFLRTNNKPSKPPSKLPRMPDYKAYLLSPHWKKTKLNYFKTHRRECCACGYRGILHLHHATYKNMGVEEEGDLVALCQPCHYEIHNIHKKCGGDLYRITWQFILDHKEVVILDWIK